MSEQLCHCGRPLHYSRPELRAAVERMIALAGDEYVTVRVGTRSWRVQRHYIGLHGLKAAEIATLGFEEMT